MKRKNEILLTSGGITFVLVLIFFARAEAIMFLDFRLWTAIGSSSMCFGFLTFFIGLFFTIFGRDDTSLRLGRAQALIGLGLAMIIGGYIMLANAGLFL